MRRPPPGGDVHQGRRAAGSIPGQFPRAVVIGQHRIDLPCRAIRSVHPDLVLDGIAAGGVRLDIGGHPLCGQSLCLDRHLRGGVHLDAQVIDRARLTHPLDEHELEGRLPDGEVGVAGADLGRSGVEQRRVEGDGLVEVGDVERELHTGHGDS